MGFVKSASCLAALGSSSCLAALADALAWQLACWAAVLLVEAQIEPGAGVMVVLLLVLASLQVVFLLQLRLGKVFAADLTLDLMVQPDLQAVELEREAVLLSGVRSAAYCVPQKSPCCHFHPAFRSRPCYDHVAGLFDTLVLEAVDCHSACGLWDLHFHCHSALTGPCLKGVVVVLSEPLGQAVWVALQVTACQLKQGFCHRWLESLNESCFSEDEAGAQDSQTNDADVCSNGPATCWM